MPTVQHLIQSRNLALASPEDPVYAAAVVMAKAGVGALCILEDDQLVGIFSERDLMTRVVVPGLDPKKTRVGDVMSANVVTATLDERCAECVEKMKRRGCRHLPIMAEGRVISMLSMRDLLRDELDERDREIDSLREYLHREGPL